MAAIQYIFVWAVVLVSIWLGAIGQGDKLLYGLSAFCFATLLAGYTVHKPTQNLWTVRIPSLHRLSTEEAEKVRGSFLFLGRPLPLGDARIITFRMSTRGMDRILFGIVCGLGLAYWNHTSYDPQHNVAGLFAAEISAVAVLTLAYKPCLTWFLERHLLNDADTVFTWNYQGNKMNFYGTSYSYSFHDEQGELRGGASPKFPSAWKDGEVILIFYDKRNPDRSRANFGFQFHELSWETPASAAASLV